MESKLKNKRGIVLLLTLVIMGILMIIVIISLSMTDREIKIIDGKISDNQAFYIADAGIQYAIYQLHNNPNWDENGGVNHPIGIWPPDHPLEIGNFIVDVRDITGGVLPTQYKRITSTGTVEGISRMVKRDIAVTP